MTNSNLNRKLLLIAIVGISFSLRAPITSIGSLAGLIRDDLGVSNSFVGFITTLPLIIFAVCSPFVSKVSTRLGIGKTMMMGLLAIVAGGILRGYTGTVGLLIGTALIGVGISAANVLIPSIVKLKFPERIGIVTSLYITAMAVFASVGAGGSYPLAMTGLGWGTASAVWAGVALLAVFAWFPQRKLGAHTETMEEPAEIAEPARMAEPAERKAVRSSASGSIWKSPLAWYLTLFFGMQSLNFYSLTAWLPSMLQGYGMAPDTAGYMALWFQLVGTPSSFLAPILAARMRNQRTIVNGICISYFLGLVLLVTFHSTLAVLIALFFLANGGAASFSWIMAMFSLKSADAGEAISLAGMSQSVGYLLSAIGPTLCGVIFDAFGDWSLVFVLFFAMTAVMAAAGILASKKEKLFP